MNHALESCLICGAALHILLGAMAGPLMAMERDLGPEYNEITRAVVTPHWDWAPALEGGALKVFSPAQPQHQRDIVELAQRFELDFVCLNTERWGFGYRPGNTITSVKGADTETRLEQFRSIIAQNLDVMVMDGQFLFEPYPDEVTFKILDKVRAGTGLVIFTHYGWTGDGALVPCKQRREEIDRILYKKGQALADTNHFLSAGVPFRALTAWAEIRDEKEFEGKMTRRQFGRGRILILTPLFPATGSSKPSRFTPPNTYAGAYAPFFEREYYYAFAMKALLWAAQKEPAVLINSFALVDAAGQPLATADAESTEKTAVTLALQGNPGKKAGVDWVVRDREGARVHAANAAVADNRAVLPLPALARGRYFVDAFVRQGGKTLNWGSTLVEVTGRQGIARLEPGAVSLAPGERLAVKINLQQKAAANTRIRLSAAGSVDRLLKQMEAALEPGQQDILLDYTHTDSIGRLLQLKAELILGERLLDWQTAYIPVRLPIDRQRFHFMVMGTSGTDDFSMYLQAQQLAALGFDYNASSYLGLNPVARKTDRGVERSARAASSLNFGQYADITSFQPHSQTNHIRVPCLTDPTFLAAEKAKLAAVVRPLKKYGVMYFLGDENTLQTPGNEVCFSPTCRAGFRGHLQAAYGGITNLNAAWQTAFNSWDEVAPADLKTARDLNQPGRWIDHRLFMGRVWVNMFRQDREWIHAEDPGAIIGLDYLCPGHGDFGEVAMSQAMAIHLPTMESIYFEAVRRQDNSQTLKGMFGFWGFHGDCSTKAKEWRRIWDAFLAGTVFCNLFASMPGDPQSYIAADLRPYPYLKPILAEADVVRKGIDGLLLPLRPTIEIGILWSEAAQYAGEFHKSPCDHRAGYLAARNLIWDSGANAHLVDADELLRPETTARLRVIVLPACPALSKAQAQALRAFVEKGGTLIADARPAVMNEHGHILEKGALDELFGVAGAGPKPRMEFRNASFKLAERDYALKDVLVETGLKPAGAQPAGEAGGAPILLEKTVGQGRAVLLNLPVELAFNGANRPNGCLLLRKLLAGAGVILPVESGRANHYGDGASEYVVFIGDAPETRTVCFEREGHVYDGRAGAYLGLQKQAAVKVREPGGRWISALPYRVAALEVAGPEKIEAGQPWIGQVAIQTRDGAPLGRHVFGVVALDPDGREARHYRLAVEAKNGTAGIRVPFCLSDPAGNWQIIVRDTASGLAKQLKVKLLKGGG